MNNQYKSINRWVILVLTIIIEGTFCWVYKNENSVYPPVISAICVAALFLILTVAIPAPKIAKARGAKAHGKTQSSAIASKIEQARAVTTGTPAPAFIPESQTDNITFDDIAGYETTKESMQFIVDCLTNKDKLTAIGAKIPAGILLYGPPGTGKTLFAKAIANTTKSNILMVNASQFIEMYVGVGAKNVRALYAMARKSAPCIVFIDEIDAVGGKRTGTMNDERRQTLNQLLVELNGASINDGVLTIAATNDLESLDQALLRPGRFDRHIAIPLPNNEDREKIITHYFSKKPIAKDVSAEDLALMTEGMSGSSIAIVINEAAIHAVANNRKVINKSDIDAAVFQNIMQGEQKSITNPDDLKIVAYHEAGHALALKLLTTDSVPSVTIIGSTSGAGGVTFRHSSREKSFSSKRDMESQIKVSYAGRAAEECYFGNNFDITNGASSDLKEASIMLREYLTTYGMGADSILNLSAFTNKNDNSSLIEEAKALSATLYQSTQELLRENADILDEIAMRLLEKKTLRDKELVEIISTFRPAMPPVALA